MSQTGMDRLERAMSIWLDNEAASTPRSPDELLAAHPDLRDLLEPLVVGKAPSAEPPVDPSTLTFDDFRIVREIGRGGMGIVYEARQLSLDRRTALKLLPNSAGLAAKAVARFKREALTTARLDHPGIVDVLAVGDSPQGHWFAMEFIDGVTLDRHAQKLREDDPDTAVRDITAACAAVAEALAHAHEAGVVHRDIKPSNVLVKPDGNAVLTDFGVARANSLPSVTQTGELNGTPFYVSPEQVSGGPIDARSDVFSLGVTLYELLTTKRPFDGESSREVLDQIVRCHPPSPSRIDHELPRDLSAIVQKAIEKLPEHRYESANAMAEDLRRFLAHRPVVAQPIGVVGRLRRWQRREPLKAALAGTLLVGAAAVVGLAGYVWWTQDATDIGRDALRTTQVEQMLLDAVLSRLTLGGNKKAELMPQVLELAPDDAYALVAASLYYQSSKAFGPAHALRIVTERDPAVDDPGLDRMSAFLRRRVDNPSDPCVPDSELEATPQSAVDAYVLSFLAMETLGPLMGQTEAWNARSTQAMQFALHAITHTPRPRSMYYVALNRAARCLRDDKSVLMATQAMAEHWPESAGAWVFQAMALDDFRPDSPDVERAARRSLQLSPDNFIGLKVLGRLADSRGDDAEAARITAQLELLYPAEMAWRRGGKPRSKNDSAKNDSAKTGSATTGHGK